MLFAAWTWREGRAVATVTTKVPEHRFVLAAVVSALVLAELGDKTMLATMALASDQHWAGVWLGATAGMLLADGLALAVGILLHRRLPARLLHVLASMLFLIFGLWLLIDGALGWRTVAVAVTASAAALATVAGVSVSLRRPGPHVGHFA